MPIRCKILTRHRFWNTLQVNDDGLFIAWEFFKANRKRTRPHKNAMAFSYAAILPLLVAGVIAKKYIFTNFYVNHKDTFLCNQGNEVILSIPWVTRQQTICCWRHLQKFARQSSLLVGLPWFNHNNSNVMVTMMVYNPINYIYLDIRKTPNDVFNQIDLWVYWGLTEADGMTT